MISMSNFLWIIFCCYFFTACQLKRCITCFYLHFICVIFHFNALSTCATIGVCRSCCTSYLMPFQQFYNIIFNSHVRLSVCLSWVYPLSVRTLYFTEIINWCGLRYVYATQTSRAQAKRSRTCAWSRKIYEMKDDAKHCSHCIISISSN